MAVQDRRDPGSVPAARTRQSGTLGPLRHGAGRRRVVPDERNRVCADQTEAAGRMQSVLHRQPAWRRVLGGRRGGQNQPAVLQQGPADQEDLVLRLVRHQARQAQPIHAGSLRRFLQVVAKTKEERTQLDCGHREAQEGALRHTCGAWFAMAGEYPTVVQKVMRHESITLTMDTYGHLFPGAVGRLRPILDTREEALQATGTDDVERIGWLVRSAQDAILCRSVRTGATKPRR